MAPFIQVGKLRFCCGSSHVSRSERATVCVKWGETLTWKLHLLLAWSARTGIGSLWSLGDLGKAGRL